MKPELFGDAYLFDICEQLHKRCMEKDCFECPCKYDADNIGGDPVCKVDVIMELWRRLENATANQKHAHWKVESLPDMKGLHHEIYVCSHCNGQYIGQRKRNYCPECGERMD